MASDIVLSSELKSLQEEVAAARRARQPASLPGLDRATADAPRAAGAMAIATAAPDERAEAQALGDQLGELVDQVAHFFEGAEKNIAAHPAESVIAALLLGILIGRLLGRG